MHKQVFLLNIGGCDTVINPTPDGTSGHRIHIDQLHRVSPENGKKVEANVNNLEQDYGGEITAHRRTPGHKTHTASLTQRGNFKHGHQDKN